jgi:predicted TIM-barrel fold metal-dependent hydrolase
MAITERAGAPVESGRWGKVDDEERQGLGERRSGVPTRTVDCDMHVYEPRGMWADYCEPSKRHLALDLTDDELGHTWLTHQGRRVYIAEVHHPAEPARMDAYRRQVRAGIPAEVHYDEALPREFWDPALRAQQLDGFGLTGAVVFPNYGLLWERSLSDDLDSVRVNMAAWNRYAAAVRVEGRGRLHPVGHVTLRDLDWLDNELAHFESSGIRLAMVSPCLVDGKRLSHPDLDRAWAGFADHGVAPVFHVSAFPTFCFEDAWFEADPEPVIPALGSVFLATEPALALADLAMNGTFARHADLRLGIMELSAYWVPSFLRMLDGGCAFYEAFIGESPTKLPEPPSTYVRQHVRVAAFGFEQPAQLIEATGEDLFMFCSDYPHAEGIADPVDDYRLLAGDVPGRAGEQLWAGNIDWLLGV